MNIQRMLDDNLMDTIRALRAQLMAESRKVQETADTIKSLELIALASGMDPYAPPPVAHTNNPES